MHSNNNKWLKYISPFCEKSSRGRWYLWIYVKSQWVFNQLNWQFFEASSYRHFKFCVVVRYLRLSKSPPIPKSPHVTAPLFTFFVFFQRTSDEDGSSEISRNNTTLLFRKELPLDTHVFQDLAGFGIVKFVARHISQYLNLYTFCKDDVSVL